MCGGQLRQSNDLPKRKEVTGGGLDGSGPSHRKRVIGWRDARRRASSSQDGRRTYLKTQR